MKVGRWQSKKHKNSTILVGLHQEQQQLKKKKNMVFYLIWQYKFWRSIVEAYKTLTLLPGFVVHCGREKAVATSDTHLMPGGFHEVESSFL